VELVTSDRKLIRPISSRKTDRSPNVPIERELSENVLVAENDSAIRGVRGQGDQYRAFNVPENSP